jgi:hypothetical protein
MNIASQIAYTMEENAQELNQILNASWAMMGSYSIDICVALLAIAVVQRITALQQQAMLGEQEELVQF